MSSRKEAHQLAQVFVGRPDYVQGGGGNFSIKADSQHMLIKASGFQFVDINEHAGLAEVDYSILNEYIDLCITAQKCPTEHNANEILTKVTRGARASMESWFHGLSSRVILHTHSVYTNLIACMSGGEYLCKKLYQESPLSVVWVPYRNPGFTIGLQVHKTARVYKKQMGHYPDVYILQNHGIIVCGNTAGQVLARHESINQIARAYFNCSPQYDAPKVIFNEGWKSATRLLEGISLAEVSAEGLFPDQLVYQDTVPLRIKAGKILYQTEKGKTAQTMEETLAAYKFIRETLLRNGYTTSVIHPKDAHKLINMDAEKYRQASL